MRFRYLGDKENMTAFGYDFSNGATPEVEDANAVHRLNGNSHFEAVEETASPWATPRPWVDPPATKNKGGRPRKVQP